MAKSSAVTNPNLGLYLDRPSIAVPKGALQDGINFRVREGKLTNFNLGWTRLGNKTLNGPVMLITNLKLRSGTTLIVVCTPTDVYKYTPSTDVFVYLSPIYATGTVAVSGTGVTGTGTAWTANAKVGDEIYFGSATQTSTSVTWYTIQNVGGNTSITLTGSAGVIGAGSTYTIRKRFTGTAINIWQDRQFVNAAPASEDQLFLTNGIQVPMRWNGTDAQVTELTGLGFTCKTLAVYRNMMIYGNLTQSGTSKPTDIVNSDVGSPSLAGSAGVGLSEQFKVHGGTDELKRMEVLGDNLVLYSKETVTVANFVGDPFVFLFRNAVQGKGLQAVRGLGIFPDYHHFIGPDALYMFDGNIAHKTGMQVWREVLRSQDPARINQSFGYVDEVNGDMIWSVPSTIDPGTGTVTSPPSQAWVEHYLEDVGNQNPKPYSRRSFPFTAIGPLVRSGGLTWDQISSQWSAFNYRWNDQFFAATFPSVIVGDTDGKLYTLSAAQDANGTALPSFVKFGRRPLVDGKMRALLTRVLPFVSQLGSTIDIVVRLADFAMGPATINATFPYNQTLVEGAFFISAWRRGRFLDLEFGSAGPNEPWEISGYDVEVRQGGKR